MGCWMGTNITLLRQSGEGANPTPTERSPVLAILGALPCVIPTNRSVHTDGTF